MCAVFNALYVSSRIIIIIIQNSKITIWKPTFNIIHTSNEYSLLCRKRKAVLGVSRHVQQRVLFFTSLTHTSSGMCNTGETAESSESPFTMSWCQSKPSVLDSCNSCIQSSFLRHILLPREHNRATLFSCKYFHNHVYSKGWSQWKETHRPGVSSNTANRQKLKVQERCLE